MVLTTLLACPLIGLLLILGLPKSAGTTIRRIALIASGTALAVSLQLLAAYPLGVEGLQFQERMPWIPMMNISYHVGIDGLSLPLIVMTTLLSFLACIGSASITERLKEYYAVFLLLEVGMIGTFIALDLFLFYIFWELVLVPMYLMIGIWGGGRREYSAIKFFLYTLGGSLFMLLAILALYFQLHTFDLVELARLGPGLQLPMQKLLFLGFFLGFAVKVPIFPFHTWLPDAHVDAPTPGSVLLAGVLLKMGGYGFFRIAYPVCPDAAVWFGGAMAVLGAINIVYGAFVAMAQTDLKKLVAYSSVSHMGFVLLGLASFTPEGLNGALFQMISHGLVTGGMFLLVGVLYDRAHTRQLDAFGGLGVVVPRYAGFLLFFSLASLGLPGMSGFVGEFMALIGTYGTHQWPTIISVLGIVIAAAYMLMVLQQVLLGPVKEKWAKLPDMTARELVSLTPLLIAVLALGVYPMWLLRIQEPDVQNLLGTLIGR